MVNTPIDAARLRAAVADDRYWQAGHPEHGAWRQWVGDGFQALYGGDDNPNERANSGVVHVRAYMRNGQQVAEHSRRAPANSRSSPLSQRHNLLEEDGLTPVADRLTPLRYLFGLFRDRRGTLGRRPPTSQGRTRGSASTSSVSPRNQELVDIVAPGGQPIGTRRSGTDAEVRTLPGGADAAEAMFRRLITGRNPVEITPQRFPGTMYRLDDGAIISYRPMSKSPFEKSVLA